VWTKLKAELITKMAATKLKCVFVHGWGMNRQIWQPLLPHLPDWIEPQCIDLPGHGELAHQPFTNMHDLLQSLHQQVDGEAVWIAWSLGGLAVCELALQHPEKVRAMIQVSSSPCFTRRDDWLCGIENAVFEQFENALQKDFNGTIQRFLALQVKGANHARPLLKQLREIMQQQNPASPQALKQGLKLLQEIDLRKQLQQLKMPVLWLLGKYDSLVKPALADELKKLAPHIQSHVFEHAAHAAFLSDAENFAQQLSQFLAQLTRQQAS